MLIRLLQSMSAVVLILMRFEVTCGSQAMRSGSTVLWTKTRALQIVSLPCIA